MKVDLNFLNRTIFFTALIDAAHFLYIKKKNTKPFYFKIFKFLV